MISPEQLIAQGVTQTDMRAVLDARLDAVVSDGTFSTRNGKVVEAIHEEDGRKAIVRGFSDTAVDGIEYFSDTTFEEAWAVTQRLFTGKNMRPVDSSLVGKTDLYSQLVISEYVEGTSIVEAPTELKVDLARNLAEMFTKDERYVPSIEMLMGDMFRVVEKDDGTHEAVLIDVDPRLTPRDLYGMDSMNAVLIQRMSSLLWDDWCRGDERKEVLKAFFVPLVTALGVDGGLNTLDAIMVTQLMTQGLDTRRLGSQISVRE